MREFNSDMNKMKASRSRNALPYLIRNGSLRLYELQRPYGRW
jgi:hypothetical protein